MGDIGGALIFLATEPMTGTELWRSDGTDSGTVLIDEVIRGSGSPAITAWGDLGDTLLFFAREPSVGYELWKTDGLTVTLVSDINPGPAGSLRVCGSNLTRVVNGIFMFAADDGAHGTELWASDGDSARLVADLAPGATSSCPREFAGAGPLMFFTANDSRTGDELWAIGRAALGGEADGTGGEAARSVPIRHPDEPYSPDEHAPAFLGEDASDRLAGAK